MEKAKINLSKRASKYLKSLQRDLKWASKEGETRAYLLSHHVHPFDEFLKFQVCFSGFELTIKGDSKESFSAALFSKKQIKSNEKLDLEKAGNSVVEVCGIHATAQFTFFITHKGEICTLDDNDLPNIIYSSFEKMLEAYALRNEIHNWESNPYYYQVRNEAELLDMMDDEFQTIDECSDLYSTWWKNENLIAVKGVYLDRAEPYFHVYGKTREPCDALIERLKTLEILA